MGWEKLPPTPRKVQRLKLERVRSHPTHPTESQLGPGWEGACWCLGLRPGCAAVSRALGCWQRCQRGPAHWPLGVCAGTPLAQAQAWSCWFLGDSRASSAERLITSRGTKGGSVQGSF